jgi:hypothetical protein
MLGDADRVRARDGGDRDAQLARGVDVHMVYADARDLYES